MQQDELWQEWNRYLLGRTEHLNQAITELCFQNQAKICQLFQEEIQRGIYEWNCLQFQKMMADWRNVLLPPLYQSR